MAANSGGIVLLLSFLGIMVFLLGLALAVCNNQVVGLALAGVGFAACCGSILHNSARAKALRAKWPVVNARCTDRQLLKKTDHEDGDFRLWQLVCEVNVDGKQYLIYPKVRWNDATQSETPFRDEKKAKQFIEQTFPADGQCKLRVNPVNPLEGELLI